jgi:hypothetical protein
MTLFNTPALGGSRQAINYYLDFTFFISVDTYLITSSTLEHIILQFPRLFI